MGVLQPLEKPLEDINAKLPALPKSAKDLLAKISPWLSLLAGVWAAWSAYQIWHWARAIDAIADWANSFSRALGGPGTAASRWSFWLYVSIGVLVVSAIIYVLAVSPLRTFKKQGWDLLFLGIVINFVYGIVILFDSAYGGFGSFFGQLVGTAIGLYLLFQIRDYYVGKAKVAPAPAAPAAPVDDHKDQA